MTVLIWAGRRKPDSPETEMKSRLQCETCRELVSVDDRYAGRRIRCPMCDDRIEVLTADPSRMLFECDLNEVIPQSALSAYDQAYALQLLTHNLIEEATLRKHIRGVITVTRKGQKALLGERLTSAGLLSGEVHTKVSSLTRGQASSLEEALKDCPNCFTPIRVDADSCPFCQQSLGDLTVMDMCPGCKQEQPSGAAHCEHCGADMKTGIRPNEKVLRCPRCENRITSTTHRCPHCRLNLKTRGKGRRGPHPVKRVLDEIADQWIFLLLLAAALALYFGGSNWEAVKRAYFTHTQGEAAADLRDRVDAADRALRSGDLQSLASLCAPAAKQEASEGLRSVLLGAEDARLIVKTL
ncbi:MAG: zinc ribbon domain-containing protein, partial [Planctomycetota bacterium]